MHKNDVSISDPLIKLWIRLGGFYNFEEGQGVACNETVLTYNRKGSVVLGEHKANNICSLYFYFSYLHERVCIVNVDS